MGSLLREYYGKDKVHTNKDFIYAEGVTPVALVAHADTVHVTLPQEIFYDRKQNVIWSPEGIGADDRAGIYAIIEILREGLRPTVIICNEEETGGKGAAKFVKAFPKPRTKVNFMIELDRMGDNDMVFYACDNPDFEDYLAPYGFITDWGTFSDIATIAPKWKIAAVNLSIGYMDEHTKSERLYVEPMLDTIGKVKAIIQDEMVQDHPFEYIECEDYYAKMWDRYSYGTYGYYDYSSAPIKNISSKYASSLSTHKCEFCGYGISPGKGTTVEAYGEKFHLCDACAEEISCKCEVCGKTFFPQTDEETICFKCRRSSQK